MLAADVMFTSRAFMDALKSREIQYAIQLASCRARSPPSPLWVLLTTHVPFPVSRQAVDRRRIDIPIVLPPLVIGLSLLICSKRRRELDRVVRAGDV